LLRKDDDGTDDVVVDGSDMKEKLMKEDHSSVFAANWNHM
jgi:hypothetical protein